MTEIISSFEDDVKLGKRYFVNSDDWFWLTKSNPFLIAFVNLISLSLLSLTKS